MGKVSKNAKTNRQAQVGSMHFFRRHEHAPHELFTAQSGHDSQITFIYHSIASAQRDSQVAQGV